jgi:hypothetical protein
VSLPYQKTYPPYYYYTKNTELVNWKDYHRRQEF